MELDDNDAWGLACYSVITPLVSRDWTESEYNEELKRIVAHGHLFPGGVLKQVEVVQGGAAAEGRP